MKLSWDIIQSNAITFSKKWQKAESEEAEAQSFVTDFLRVFGIIDPLTEGAFEHKSPLKDGKTGYIDYLRKNKIAIEMKSRGKDLNEAFVQLQNYMQNLPPEEIPDLWMVCDFETIILNRRSTNEIWTFKTKDLRKHIKRFADLAGYETERDKGEQIEVNIKAAEKMAKLYDALKSHGYEGQDLEIYLVRLLFCLFADDTGIFPKNHLYNYIENSKKDGSDLTYRISDLFEVLNMNSEVRVKKTLLSDELKQFQYINGTLFALRLPPANFNPKMRQTLLDCLNFDWNKISPAIFGAMFQGVMDKSKRREMGVHYTSEENIEKLINPLFLDELWAEFNKVKTDPAALDNFHNKIARLKFLDPACGCGNFLIVTYGKLRELELEILKMKIGSSQLVMDISKYLKVSIEQFYGIEYEEFPCQIAQVGMWLIDHQMNLLVSEQFGLYFARLPLSQGATIVHGNALRIDWEEIAPKDELSYILGNPPFLGARIMSPIQKEDMLHVFGKIKNLGNLDYVTAWYKKAADIMEKTAIKSAFVSTNSISQGEQPAILWKPLMERGVHINFGIPTFKWSNEAKGKAAVYCVIVGFSYHKTEPNINPYLLQAPTVFIESRKTPICDVPEIGIGNKPIDGGNYLFTTEEKDAFLQKEPNAEKRFRPWIGSSEFINGYTRYCLWLGNCSPGELRKMPEVMKRVEAVRQFRLDSKSLPTQKLAATPTRFHVENFPEGTFIVIPKVSTARRQYIPMGFLTSITIASDLLFLIPKADLYHFGVLTSGVHMAWMRAVCGRLGMGYRYSKDIVYNNFPWPTATDTDEQKSHIEKLAQAVLDARANYPDSSLADLYDPLTMPPDLLKAHRALDAAVMKLYGFPTKNFTEADCIAALMEMYQALVNS